MMDINRKEKEILYEWSKLKKENFLFTSKNGDETYFVSSKERDYLQEYDLNSIEDIQAFVMESRNIKNMNDKIMKVICIAAMKNKPNLLESNASIKNDDAIELPDYIYNF